MNGAYIVEKILFMKYGSLKDYENVPKTACLSIVVLCASGDLAKKNFLSTFQHLSLSLAEIVLIFSL